MAYVDQFYPENPEWVDFDQFLDLPSGYDDQSSATVSPQDLALPCESEFTSPVDVMTPSFATTYDYQDFMSMDGGFMQDPAAPLFDDASFAGYNPYDSSNAFRGMVEAQAAADPRVATIKEKRREAAIALHLQRLCDATALDLDMSSDSNTSFSSPSWSDYVYESRSPLPSPKTTVAEAPPPAAMEIVLDLNMNATANVPKKQKPRSQAQKENYIKARKYGACEKHKKQHKRCNCLEKAAARATASESPTTVALQGRPEQPKLQLSAPRETCYPVSPGQNPSLQTQSLSSVRPIREASSSSPGHHSLIRPSVTPQDVVKTKFQKSTPPGPDSVHPGVSSFNNMSPQDMVVKSGKLAAKNAISALNRAAPPGRNVTNASVGHDVVQPGLMTRSPSGRDIASGKKALSSSAGHEILLSGKKSGTSASHDILLSGNAPKTAAADRGYASCQSTHLPGTARVPSGPTGLRWRVSLSSTSTQTNRTTPSGVSSIVPCTALDVRPRTVRSTVPGTIVSGIVPAAHGIHPGGTSVAPGLQRGSAPTLAAAMHPVSRDQLASPSRLGSGVGDRSPDVFGNGLVHSLTRVGGMLSSSVSVVLCAQLSLSIARSVEGALNRGLSSAGRYLLSARKAFNWRAMQS
ncbi:unnamed protein product [Penicillium salamii]|uniref:Uncharacterized protein n=1 Tax=Penicillium salamii TaxID=1612424 RepID=A0A9W4N7I0_9EURO|nr:unnamed protein product [Penicillium salamii]